MGPKEWKDYAQANAKSAQQQAYAKHKYIVFDLKETLGIQS